MTQKKKNYFIFCSMLLFLVAWIWFLKEVGADNVVKIIGVDNIYIVAFALAVFGGVSSFTAAPFYAAIVTFAVGGANALVLGITAGLGLVISDSVFFYFGTRSREVLSDKMEARITKFGTWIKNRPSWFVPIGIFLYTTLAPLPNDLFMISLALIKYPYKKLLPPLLAGDVTFVVLLAFLAKRGIEIFHL